MNLSETHTSETDHPEEDPSVTGHLRVEMVSDWHVGEGAGRPGDVDRLVRRNFRNRLPALPGKTLNGVWRDGCEAVAAGLDGLPKSGSPPQFWARWVTALFGDQPSDREHYGNYDAPLNPARVSVRPAAFPARLAEALAARPTLQDAVTFIKPGVKIDGHTGQAREDHLRFEEVARGGVSLETTVDLASLTPKQQELAWALLWAGASAVERLGGKRRRGLGKCRWTLSVANTTEQQLLQRLEQECQLPNENRTQPPELPSRHQDETIQIPAEATGSVQRRGFFRVPLRLQLRLPLVISSQTTGNVVESLDFVPGTLLLPALSGPLDQLLGRSLLPEIARGDLRVTPATVELEGHPGRPIPLALFFQKDRPKFDNGGQVWNRFREPEPENQDIILKPHRDGYVGPFSETSTQVPTYRRPTRVTTTHNVIDDEPQRPTSDVGGVFTYQALPPGLVLRAELLLRPEIKEELDRIKPQWLNKLAGKSGRKIRLGIAKKDDYGLVQLTVRPLESPEPAEKATSVQVRGDGSFSLWALSDILLRQPSLGPAAHADWLRGEVQGFLRQSSLTQQLSLSIPNIRSQDPHDPDSQQGKLITASVWTRRTEGWCDAWGQARPSYLTIQAGSCVVFKIQGWENLETDVQSAVAERLNILHEEGLGERRAEGFGMLAINDPLLTRELSNLEKRWKQPPKQPPTSAPLLDSNDEGHSYLCVVEEAAWRTVLRRLAGHLGSNDLRRKEILKWNSSSSKPSNTQLGSLRSVLAELDSYPTGSQQALGWVDAVDKADRGWPEGSLEVLKELFTNPECIWNLLPSAVSPDPKDVPPQQAEAQKPKGPELFPFGTKGGRQRLQRALWGEAVRTLLLACIHGEVRCREQNN